MHDRVFDPAKAHKLEDPERTKWLPIDPILDRFGIRDGDVIADIGVGTGYFAIPMARRTPNGRVIGVDLQPEMLELFRRKLGDAAAPSNVETRLGRADATTLGDHSVDVVLLANLWHEIDDLDAATKEIERILRPGGTLAILDWRPDVQQPPGPPLDHRIPSRDARERIERHGFREAAETNLGEYSYLVTAKAPERESR
ncbi:MAG: class I SAM-dependent methyltransferase [Thermoanaerobaculia bacterium]